MSVLTGMGRGGSPQCPFSYSEFFILKVTGQMLGLNKMGLQKDEPNLMELKWKCSIHAACHAKLGEYFNQIWYRFGRNLEKSPKLHNKIASLTNTSEFWGKKIQNWGTGRYGGTGYAVLSITSCFIKSLNKYSIFPFKITLFL